MKNNEASVFIFIASIIIGILISSNISFQDKNKKVFLNAKQYQEAYKEKNSLYNEIGNLNKEYQKKIQKLDKYIQNETNEKKIVEEMKNELNKNKNIMGKTKLKGQGIEIYMSDVNSDFSDSLYRDAGDNIHNTDLFKIINELKVAGAEAISINGFRVVHNTAIYCRGPFLRINGISIPQPFTIKAIGNKEKLKAAISAENSVISMIVKFRTHIKVSINESEEIIIHAYDANIPFSNLKNVK